MSFRTVTVEDDRRYRGSLEELLGSAPEFELTGSFGTAEAALERSPGEGWDLFLMDLDLPGMDGIEATRQLKASRPESTVVVLTVFETPGSELEAICAGGDATTEGAEVGLTDREREVLGCLVEGLPYKQVADRFDISHNTVPSHVRDIYGKLQVQNVAQAVNRALREGLV